MLENFANLLAKFRRHSYRRRFFQQFLVPPLDGTLALSEADDCTVLIAQYLKLDVTRVLYIFLHVEIAVAKGCGSFGLRLTKQGRQLVFIANDAHAATATAGSCFDDDRKPNLPGPFDRLSIGTDYSVRAGEDGHAMLLHGSARLFFFAH